MKRGITDIIDAKRGTTQISKIMRGTTLIWENVSALVSGGLVLHLDAGNVNSYSGTGLNWYDLSGSGNNGVLSDSTMGTQVANTMMFDSLTDYVDLPNSLDYTTEVSAFAIFKGTGAPGNGYHILLGGSELEISIPTNGELRCGVETTSSRYVANKTANLLDGSYHYVGFTLKDGVMTFYKDGVNIGTRLASGTLVNDFAFRRLGVHGDDTRYYLNGELPVVNIYNKGLTASEVQQNFLVYQSRFNIM